MTQREHREMSENQCSICMESYRPNINKPMVCSPCGHGFCEPCLQRWKRQSRECPTCRQVIQSTTLNRSLIEILEATTLRDNYQSSGKIFHFEHSSSLERRKNEVIHDKSNYSLVVLDNSGSMLNDIDDGAIFKESDDGKITKVKNVSRWEEACSKLTQIMNYNLARGMPTRYYHLNPKIREHWELNKDYLEVIDSKPSESLLKRFLSKNNVRGNTPLDKITNFLSLSLYNNQEKICYCIITDGQPNDKTLFEESIRKMCQKNQIFMVINLCTDDKSIIDYYNELDSNIGTEISGLDVVDDFEGEYKEIISKGNNFIVYTYQLHTCRMAGCYSVVSDLLDEEYLGDKTHYVQKLCNELLSINSHAETINKYIDHILIPLFDHDFNNSYLVYDYQSKDFRPPINIKKLRNGNMMRKYIQTFIKLGSGFLYLILGLLVLFALLEL